MKCRSVCNGHNPEFFNGSQRIAFATRNASAIPLVMSAQTQGEKVFTGIAVSAGVCRGKVLVLHQTRHVITQRAVPAAEIPSEIKRFEQSLLRTRQQISEIQRRVAETMSSAEADIFDAHLLMLEDHVLIDEVLKIIRDQQANAEFAFHSASEKYVAVLEAVEDEYLRERAADLRDLSARVLDNLLEVKDQFDLRHLTEPCILVGRDLSPSVTAQLDKKFVLGFATDIGGKTSHTAIMARSLDIPAIVGLQTISEELNSGDYILLDGYSGTVTVNPTDRTLFAYGQLEKNRATLEEKLHEILWQPAVTLCGQAIHLSANIEDQHDIDSVIQHGAEGVGLFRTEFLFLNHAQSPDEEEQFQAYRAVAAALKPHHVIIRTLDLGGDKFASQLQLAQEMNPFLGWRAIRFCLAQPELFRAQLRAILRASAEGNVKMMYPMISGLDEWNQATALLDKCKAELRAEKIPFDEHLEVGAMIEIPSAALIAESLAKRVKFFSIGSNDLIQYTLAADRTNDKVSHLYEPTHPAILRLIKMTVDAAKKNGIWTGVCGEIGGDPVLVPLLIGLGIDELSCAPAVIPEVKYMIRRIKMEEARALAEFAMQSESPTEILARCLTLARATAPSLFSNAA
jgi:phosphoenolpyruvate-protein phosphotransferase (PTS system enzyme I)